MKKKNLLMTAIAIFGLATITMAQVPNYVPANGLLGWYPFSGNANDESGLGTNGNVINATLSPDRFNNSNSAYNFNGNNSIIDLGVNGSINSIINDLSFSYWTKLDLGSPWPRNTVLASYSNQQGSSWRFISFIDRDSLNVSSGVMVNSAWNYTNSNQNTIQFNQWYHIVHTKAGPIFKTYINGILVGNNNISNININNPNSPAATTKIGANWPSFTQEPFKGLIDDIGFWNRALTQQEITDLFGCQLSVNTQPSNQTININNNAQFVVSSSEPSAIYQWQTDIGIGFLNLNSVGQYSGTNNDTLTVSNVAMSNNNQPFRCIISSGSCSDTSNVAVLNVNNNVALNETSQDKLFSVFPNPAQSVINVKADSKLLGQVYYIYGNTGRVVLTGKLNSENTTIELGNLSGGVFVFRIGENMKQTFKVIKE